MKLTVFLCLVGYSLSFTIENKVNLINDQSWHVWKSVHKKGYSSYEEEKARYSIWQDNMNKITEYNLKSKSTKLGMNHFGDLTNTEFASLVNGYRQHSSKISGSTFMSPNHLKVPESVDWRTEGYVTPVKNQGQCGSCWAFSTTGALEGQHFRKTGKLVNLSEQNLVDCSGTYGNNGCNGGLMDNAFKYVKDNHGIDTETCYPYTATDGQCTFNKMCVGAGDTGFVDIPEGDETALKNASASVGPISVAIDASHTSFQFYREGVYDEPECSCEQLDHGVLVVGYGSENGQDYWLVKNSWGITWGENGYIRMSRNKNNQCGIASKASYPLV